MNKKSTKREIIKETLIILQKKGLLKEFSIDGSDEKQSGNDKINDLQTCLEEISSAKSYIEQLSITILNTDEQNLLGLITQKLNYVNNVINKLVGKTTANDEDLEEADNPKVQMSLDKAIEKPDDVKKLQDKQFDVEVTDEDGISLTT